MRISSEKFKHEINSIFYPSSLGEEIAKFLICGKDGIELITHIYVYTSGISEYSTVIARTEDKSYINDIEKHLRYLQKNGADTVAPSVFGPYISIDEFIPKFIDLLKRSIV